MTIRGVNGKVDAIIETVACSRNGLRGIAGRGRR